MENMLDYIAWRGDLPLNSDGFNEVDNLILSEIAYVKMDGLVPGPAQNATVRVDALYKEYRAAGYDQSYLNNDPYALLKAAAASRRFGSLPLWGFVNHIDRGEQVQFAVVTALLPDGSVFVACRGTDNTLVGWREDFAFCYAAETVGQAEAVAYLEQAAARHAGPIRVGGHSKGGNLAMYAAAFCRPDVQERIVRVYSNDGPGFNETVAAAPAFERILPKTELIIPESSLIGILLNNKQERKIVQSDATGAQQHNPYTWAVRGPAFVPADQQTASSLFMTQALGRWMDSLSESERMGFVSALFDSLDAAGAATLAELNAHKWVSYNAVAKAALTLPPERRKGLTDALKKLAAAGREVLWNETKRTFERRDAAEE